MYGKHQLALFGIHHESPLDHLSSNPAYRNRTAPFTEAWTPNTNRNEREFLEPTYVSDYPESVRCGRDNMAHAASTETLKVNAGDTLTIAHQRYDPEHWQDNQWYKCSDGRGSCAPDIAGVSSYTNPEACSATC